jgi:hypothetical protein
VTPSIVDPSTAEPFTLEQELKPFGVWAAKPVWVPPQDENRALAETMLRETRPFTAADKRWDAVVKQHRGDFTQVREIDLYEASIRLPKGRFYVTVTEQKNFDKITDTIPACVQTRLDEFLASPAMEQGAKVYYLKPLCIEVGDELILTTGEDLQAAIRKVQDEVFAEYKRLARYRRPLQALMAAVDLVLAAPRALMQYAVARKKRVIDAMQAHLEFERRKLALRTAKAYSQMRSEGCTFNDVLKLTSSPNAADVVDQYCTEQELSAAKRAQLMSIAAGSLPWFVALSLTATYIATIAMSVTVATTPVVTCDPVFVAEMPGSKGVLLKIGHFDEVAGRMHIEL